MEARLGIGLIIAIPLVDNLDLVWLSVAAFFLVFSLPAFLILPPDRRSEMSIGAAARWGVGNFKAIVAEVWDISLDWIGTLAALAAAVAYAFYFLAGERGVARRPPRASPRPRHGPRLAPEAATILASRTPARRLLSLLLDPDARESVEVLAVQERCRNLPYMHGAREIPGISRWDRSPEGTT